ncbi:restriction endonuclease subunit S [Enterococcus faecalis]|uniref:restriction endonuclease subunit S n=1 Tax=Enterococcus faecalis TaxID=1351 RepID=UPI000D67D97E|nr:restriction endonuclease subunit S [Enterococcus faecalis]NSV43933.1 restriction endonuclease subunit S [Enterococcus faecalis]PWI89795.1 restriction endonuclease subunit S [Enterococcus faecalis]
MRDEMKKVPRLRFRGFQEDWELCKLGDVANYRNGKAHEQVEDEDGKYTIINSKFISTNGKVQRYTNEQVEPIFDGEIAMVLSDLPNGKALAKLFLVKEDGKYTLNQRIAGITPKENINPIFLNFRMNRNSYFLKFDSGVTQTNLAKSQVENFVALYPTFDEQYKIGLFFTQLDNTITLHQRKLDQLKELKKAYLQVMFPVKDERVPKLRFADFEEEWELCKFGVTNSYFTDGNYGESYPSADELSDKLNGVPFLRGCNLKNGRLVEEDANYITPEKHAELTSGHLELDDIVVAVRGSLGALGYAGQENVGWNINSQLAIIRTDKSELKGQFLIQYLLSSKGQKELLSRNTGTALKQLPIKQLKDVPVPIPIIDEQDKIGSFFVNLDTTITLHQNKLNQLKSLKKSYLQNMFI